MRKKLTIFNIVFLILLILLIILYPTKSLGKTGQEAGEIMDAIGAAKGKNSKEKIENFIKKADRPTIERWYRFLVSGNGSIAVENGGEDTLKQTWGDDERTKGVDVNDVIEAIKNAYEHPTESQTEELEKYDLNKIYTLIIENNGDITSFEDVIEQWKTTVNNTETDNKNDLEKKMIVQKVLEGMSLDKAIDETDYELNSGKTDSAIYKYPSRDDKEKNNSEQSLEDMVSDANSFINSGELKLDQDALSNFSKTMYNILLAIGVVVAVIVGAIIGIKLMTSSIEEKAEAKKLLVPYIVGCAVVFGGFGIWKIVVTMLQHI